jgi:drug/metabolite transporter (DMT)-like permease
MKTSKNNIKNNSKVLLFLSILLTTSFSSFAQNKIVSLVSSVNINFAIPVICVIGLAVFLLTTFLKQKNH